MKSTRYQSHQLGLAATLTSLTVLFSSCIPHNDQSPLTSDTRAVVGGVFADEDSDISASSVLLAISLAPKEGHGACTGTLITKNLVLTAAHCVLRDDDPSLPYPPEQIELAFGNAQFDMNNHKTSFQNERYRTKAAQVIFHEGHIGHNRYQDVNDLALIRFQGNLPQGVKPAAILPLTQSEVPTAFGKEVLVAGFGMTDRNDTSKVMRLRQTLLSTGYDEGDSIFSLLSSPYDPRGICYGDSGGPSYVYIDDKPYLWAVNIQSNCKSKSWVLNLADYHDWITKKAAELKTEGPDFGPEASSDGEKAQ